jgi:hypothetical protein
MDSNIKKVIIQKSDLPPVFYDTGGYVVRYRIISDDRNRTSHWSPIFLLPAQKVNQVDGAVVFNNNVITATWGDEEDRPEYDVFVSFDGKTPFYHGTSPIHTYSFLNEEDAETVLVIIQIASTLKKLNDSLRIYQSNTIPIAL